jgi:hypothetical protein
MAITAAIQKGTSVFVYNEKNLPIFSQAGTLMGYTGSTVSVKKGSTIYTYNDKGQQISVH